MLRLFNHYFASGTVYQVVVDALLLFLSILLVAWMSPAVDFAALESAVPSALLFALLVVLLNSVLGIYRLARNVRFQDVLARVLLSLLLAMPLAWGVFTVLPWDHLQSEALQGVVLVLLGTVLAARMVSLRNRDTPWVRRVLVLGTGEEAASVDKALSHPAHPGLKVVGFYPADIDGEPAVPRERVINARSSLLDTVRDLAVDELIVAVRERRGGVLPLSQLLDCKLSGVKVLDLSSFFERVRGQVPVDSLRASWLIFGEGFRQGWVRTTIKRAFDIVAATLLLLLALPLMLVTVLAILIEDGYPVFYRQERVGQNGRTFKVTKFRSMRRDAEKDGKPRWASSNDDRITRVGRVIRKSRIDELPQLFNVLTGEMSLVGPRPERPYFVDQLTREIPFYGVRHSLKPGLTGWAQVRYQYGSSVDDAVQKLQYDLYYVKNHTLFLDLVILTETVRVVLTGEGAH